MIYLFILCVALIIAFIVYVFISTNERGRLIELIAAKDYADYKNFNLEENKDREHKSIFISREKKQGE